MTDVATVLSAIQDLEPADLPAVAMALAARMAAVRFPEPHPTLPDRLLNVKEAAKRLGMSTVTFYRQADTFPFTRRVGKNNRTIKCSERGIDRWQARS